MEYDECLQIWARLLTMVLAFLRPSSGKAKCSCHYEPCINCVEFSISDILLLFFVFTSYSVFVQQYLFGAALRSQCNHTWYNYSLS